MENQNNQVEKIHVGPENVTNEIPSQNKSQTKKRSNIFDFIFDIQNRRIFKISKWVSACIFLSALIIFIALGCSLNLWSKSWMIFFFCPVIPSIISSIARKKFSTVGILFLTIGVYCACGMNIPNFWHPWWLLFLIPIAYHVAAFFIDKYNSKKKLQEMAQAIKQEFENI